MSCLVIWSSKTNRATPDLYHATQLSSKVSFTLNHDKLFNLSDRKGGMYCSRKVFAAVEMAPLITVKKQLG